MAVREGRFLIPKRFRVIEYDGVVGGNLVSDVTGFDGVSRSHLVSASNNIAAFSSLNGTQVTESENHPSWRRRVNGVFQGDLGGPFDMHKTWSEGVNFPQHLDAFILDFQNRTVTSARYDGPVLPAAPNFLSFPLSAQSTDSQLNVLGAKAIAKCSPSSPAANLANFGVELIQDGLPVLPGLRSFRGTTKSGFKARFGGDEYLNAEFGWEPFIGDLRSISKAIIRGNREYDNYEANSGKVVRRKFSFPPVEEHIWEGDYLTNRSPWTNPSSGTLQDNSTINKGKVVRHTETRKLQWFSGGFTYYVPPETTIRNRMARQVIKARHLLGLSLTPDVVWESAPWSWAVDWFGDFGTVLLNWTNWAIDNQVLKYGYMMEHTLRRNTYTFVGPTGFRRSNVVPLDVTTCHETKVRRKATPYGFGFTWSGLSPRQLAIIAALGITRGK